MSHPFDPAEAECWSARGRLPHHASALAEAWQRFPDLPIDAPLHDRMVHTRDRVKTFVWSASTVRRSAAFA